MKSKICTASPFFLTLTLAASAALAQQASGSSATPAAAAMGAPVVSEVIVTAQRRQERQIDVPISMTIANGKTLERQGITDLSALQQLVPGLQITFAAGEVQPTLRGVGTQISSAGLAANVATYIDSFYRPIQLTTNVPFEDVDSVEVLKGPQGSLYGRNATGGAILISTLEPEDHPDGTLKLSYGNYNDTVGSLFLTGPIANNLTASIFAYGRYSDGYVKNLVPGVGSGINRYGMLIGKIKYKPTDKLSVELSLDYTRINDPNGLIYTPYKGEVIGALIPGAIVPTQPRQYAYDYRPVTESSDYGAFLKTTYDLDWAKLISLTGVERQPNDRHADFDFSNLPIESVVYPSRETVFQQEVDLVSSGQNRLQWSTGVSYFFDRATQTPVLVVNYDPPFFSVEGVQNQNSVATYGQLTYRVLDKLFITGGLRYSHDQFDLKALGAPTYTLVTANTTQQAVTPQASMRYQFTDNSQVYASFNEGYKAGGFNTVSTSSQAVKPERIRAYEVGYKAQGSKWNFQTAAFFYDYTDLQVNAYEGVVSLLLNAASARVYGAEEHFGYALTDNLKLDVGAAYVHARYTSFPAAVDYQWVPGVGVVQSSGNAAGNPLPTSPDFSANVGLTYDHNLLDGVIELSGNASYQSVEYFDAFKQTQQPGYVTGNLRATWKAPGDAWEVGGYLRNLTDQNYIKAILLQPTGFGAEYDAPLTVGVEITIRSSAFSRQ